MGIYKGDLATKRALTIPEVADLTGFSRQDGNAYLPGRARRLGVRAARDDAQAEASDDNHTPRGLRARACAYFSQVIIFNRLICSPCIRLRAALISKCPCRISNRRSIGMANVFVEALPKGRQDGSAITGYVVETAGDHVLHTTLTQAAAITWARANGHTPHVARVRHLNDKKRPDHWRAV
jgi:hypothetical protein